MSLEENSSTSEALQITHSLSSFFICNAQRYAFFFLLLSWLMSSVEIIPHILVLLKHSSCSVGCFVRCERRGKKNLNKMLFSFMRGCIFKGVIENKLHRKSRNSINQVLFCIVKQLLSLTLSFARSSSSSWSFSWSKFFMSHKSCGNRSDCVSVYRRFSSADKLNAKHSVAQTQLLLIFSFLFLHLARFYFSHSVHVLFQRFAWRIAKVVLSAQILHGYDHHSA